MKKRQCIHVAVMTCMLLLVAGCSDSATESSSTVQRPPAPAGKPIEASYESGGARVDVLIQPDDVSVGETVTLTLQASTPAGTSVSFPEVGQSLGPFSVRDSQVSSPVDHVPAGATNWRRTYVLESFIAGQAEIPALTFEFTEQVAETEGGAAPQKRSIATEPLVVRVRSSLEAEGVSAAFGEPAEPIAVPLPAEGAGSWKSTIGTLLLAILILALVGVLTWLLARRMRSVQSVRPQPPAHVWARQQLDQLAGENLPSAGRMHEYFVRLSGIVRQYIERRFGLMAPERTTEEFLRDARRSPSLGEHHKRTLATFLEAADMVKFALHRATVAEAEGAMDAAVQFVEETIPDEAHAPSHTLDSDRAGEVAA